MERSEATKQSSGTAAGLLPPACAGVAMTRLLR
jgi:hypothetical protein